MERKPNLKGSLAPSKTALIVVDVQNDFCHGEGAFSRHTKIDLTHAQKAVSALSSFTESVRAVGIPIIFVRTEHSPWTDSPAWANRMDGRAKQMSICAAGSWGSQFYRLIPQQTDYIVIKHRYSAFFETDLDLVLKSCGIENLLITGLLTNVCVESTVRDACNRDYDVVLVEDCCGALDIGEHEAAIRTICAYFGQVADSHTVLSVLDNHCNEGVPDEIT